MRHTRSLATSDHTACARVHAPRTVVRSEGSLATASSRARSPSRATPPPWGCQLPPMSAFDPTNRPWPLAGFQFRATADAAISRRRSCRATFRITWQPLQSKVCKVDGPLNLARKGRPQKGQRGCGASMSMPLTLEPESLINGKKHRMWGQCWGFYSLPAPAAAAASTKRFDLGHREPVQEV
jgi:hypothetical protein